MTLQDMIKNIDAFAQNLGNYQVDDEAQTAHIVENMDRLIADMLILRQQLLQTNKQATPSQAIRETEFFGMWADRDDIQGQSSRQWLTTIRAKQWRR